MREIARDVVDLNEAVGLVQGVSARLAAGAGEMPTVDPLRVDGYALPVRQPVSDWYIAQGHTYPSGRHTGLDINTITGGDTDLGESVYSTCAGVVVYAKQATGMYWGNVAITMSQDERGLLFWRYAHLNEIRTFEGAALRAGDELGTIGKGGHNRYWAHLHLDAWRGAIATPGAYLSRNVQWVDPVAEWEAAGYSWKWGVRK